VVVAEVGDGFLPNMCESVVGGECPYGAASPLLLPNVPLRLHN
jgi:hypothetical protein